MFEIICIAFAAVLLLMLVGLGAALMYAIFEDIKNY